MRCVNIFTPQPHAIFVMEFLLLLFTISPNISSTVLVKKRVNIPNILYIYCRPEFLMFKVTSLDTKGPNTMSMIHSSWWSTNLRSLVGQEDTLAASDRVIHILTEVIPLHSDQVTGRGCLTCGKSDGTKVGTHMISDGRSIKILHTTI